MIQKNRSVAPTRYLQRSEAENGDAVFLETLSSVLRSAYLIVIVPFIPLSAKSGTDHVYMPGRTVVNCT